MLGLIAGAGKLPVLFAEAARSSGEKVCIITVCRGYDRSLKKLASGFHEGNIFKLGAMIKKFKGEGIKKAAMLGRLEKIDFFRDLRPDLFTLRLMLKAPDWKDTSLLKAMVGGFEKAGIKILPVSSYLGSYVAKKGVYTRRKPASAELADIKFGLPIAKAVTDLDIGQTIVVKNKCVLAVEAVERTDAALLRGGKLGRGNSVAVKTARTRQDMRMDVPGIGIETIRAMIKAGISCIAIESGKMLIVDEPAVVKLAEKHGISIIAV